MDLGQKIRTARLEAGLSQRQLCGDTITRNMLSLIEHGSAKPSMTTLQILAGRLGKPVSFFLDEEAVTSPNQALMARLRGAWEAGDWEGALELGDQYRPPDPVFDREWALIRKLCLLARAEQAIRDQRLPYARTLLDRAGELAGGYLAGELEQRRLGLLIQADPARRGELVPLLMSLDDGLLLRAQGALDAGDPDRALALLGAVEDREASRWQLLAGEAQFARNNYQTAVFHFSRAEAEFPSQVLSRLEICYRELGDFQKAYEYACKQR